MRLPLPLPSSLSLCVIALVTACDKAPVPASTPTSPTSPSAASSPERALCLAEVAPGGGAVDAMIEEREKAVKDIPGKMDFWILLGRAWVEKARNSGDPGFYLHADACAQEVLKHEPDNVLAQDLRALSLMNDHKFAEAKAIVEKTIAKYPEDVMAYGSLSDADLELGDVDGAEQALQKMMDRKPALPSYVRASYLKWLRGDEAGALEAIRLAIDAGHGQKDHEPESWVLSEAANIFWYRGDVEGAAAGYDQALAEKPDEVPALVGKARCLIAQGKAKDALPLLQQAFDKTPLVDTAWWLSKAHAALGDSEHAEQWRKRAVAVGKEGDKRNLALILATTSADPADIALAQKNIDDDNAHRGGVYADDAAALVAWRAGKLDVALDKSARAVSLNTPDPRLWFHRGIILAASGDASGKKLVDDAMAKGMRFDPSAVALTKEVLKQ